MTKGDETCVRAAGTTDAVRGNRGTPLLPVASEGLIDERTAALGELANRGGMLT